MSEELFALWRKEWRAMSDLKKFGDLAGVFAGGMVICFIVAGVPALFLGAELRHVVGLVWLVGGIGAINYYYQMRRDA